MDQAQISKAIISSRHQAAVEVERIFRKTLSDLADCWHQEQPQEKLAVIKAIRQAVEADQDYQAVARQAVREVARSWCDEIGAEADASFQTKIAEAKAAL